MEREIIWILLGVSLFLLASLIYSIWDRGKLVAGIRKNTEKRDEADSQIESLEREKELLAGKLEEAKKSSDKNQRLAFYDRITGLPNELAVMEILEGAIKTLRKDETLALIYIDMEYSESFSQQMNYAYKDELLVDVADRLRQAVDENDLLGCISGERFVILAQNLDSEEVVEEKVKRVRKIFSYPFVLAATEIFMNIHMGICFGPRDGKTAQALVKNLNTALFAAKRKGKNQYCYFEEELSREMMSRIELQSQMRAGIENGEFEVYYQPQVDVKTEKVRGFEALVRWNHSTRGILLPDAFLPIAEETGLIVPIGKWVLETALRQLKKWQEEGYSELVVSINLSLRQLREKDIAEQIGKLIEETGVKRERLLFEIPELAAIEEPALVVEQIQSLEELGVQISLDNFGLGLSYLELLREVPVYAFKIDRSFVEKEDKRAMPVLMALAKSYGAVLTAGGVEEPEQKKILADVECEWVQGFLYSEPVTAEKAEEFLRW